MSKGIDRLCFNRLGNHKSTASQSPYRCHKCRGKHHTRLCTGTPPITPNSNPCGTNQHQGPSNPNTSPQILSQHQQSSAAHVHGALAPIHPTPPTSAPHLGHTSLLKTAIATVCTDYICCEANILFDEGAHRSFITHTLANQMDLKTSEKGMYSSISLRRASIKCETPSSRYLKRCDHFWLENPTPCFGGREDCHTTYKTHMHQGVEDLSHLRGLKLSHPIKSDESFDVSLLIGTDHYWDLVEDHVICGPGPKPSLQKLVTFQDHCKHPQVPLQLLL